MKRLTVEKRVRVLAMEARALFYALRDSRMPGYAEALAAWGLFIGLVYIIIVR